MSDKTLEKIASFHKCYKSNELKERINKKELFLSDSEEALYLIFSFAFYQGRRDEISKDFENKAIKACHKYFCTHSDILLRNRARVKNNSLISEYSLLYDRLWKEGVNKKADRLMVLSLVNYIQSNEEKNILKNIIVKIKSKKMNEIYKELNEIYSIGQKISSFILRDIVYIYELENHLTEGDEIYLQPIDTWIKQVCFKIFDGIDKNIKNRELLSIILENCRKEEVKPIHFNQGAWYIGAKAFKIVLENIDNIEFHD